MDISKRKSFIKDTSNFSSNILTDATDRLSYSELKNISLINNSLMYNNKSKNQNLKMPKIHLKTINNSDIDDNNNFLYSFSKRKKISKTINNIQNIKNIYKHQKLQKIYNYFLYNINID